MDTWKIVDGVIRARRTSKVLAPEPLPLPADDAREMVEELLATAGWAPFHKPAARAHIESGALTSIVPWRFHLLDAPECRALRQELLRRGDRTKVPPMLGAATALVQATWLPNLPKDPPAALFEPTVENMEHIAAAGAAVQNLLLAATARGIPTYWSSGGVLRGAEAFGWMGIPADQVLLGSIFLFPPDPHGAEVLPGSHRDRRGPPRGWSRWVILDSSGWTG
jgi:nitroreductase